MQKIIKKLLKKHKGSRAEVAKELGISPRYVLMLEKGEVQPGRHLLMYAKMKV